MKKIISGRRLLLVFAIAIMIAIGLGGWALSPLIPPADSSLTIKSGSSLIQVANQLAAKKIIRSALVFRLLARLQDRDAAIQAGVYNFSASSTPAALLDRLVAGDVVQIMITIPEGFTLQQIAERLAENRVADRTRLLAAAHDSALLNELGIVAQNLEGYLYPETYRFVPGISEPDLLRMMVAQFNQQFSRLHKSLKGELPLAKHQLVTLASIIQKETGLEEEMPLISAVFHNRLNRNIPLQTDPTVIYGIKNFNGNLTRKDLQRPSAYNTYLNRGLPPGPIANPGFKALLAAARPADSHYLYFVARGDSSHQFSKTLKEHNRAVRKYQLRRKR